ncbi:MAG TPA: hypothetical protein VF834_11015 [Streptosporangiaceae bacterium]
MQTARTDPGPPYVPIRTNGWSIRRTPRWAIAVGAVLVAIAVAVGLVHRPTSGQRGVDLRTFLHLLASDVQSCSGGVGESLFVLHAIDSGASHDVPTALGVATTGASNCSPANNPLLADLTGAQVPESLASYHLQPAITALIDWAAPRAARVQADVATVLTDRGKPSEAAARAALSRDLRALDAQRKVFYADLAPAITALSPQSRPPVLHG